jgi:hypothetical protein
VMREMRDPCLRLATLGDVNPPYSRVTVLMG